MEPEGPLMSYDDDNDNHIENVQMDTTMELQDPPTEQSKLPQLLESTMFELPETNRVRSVESHAAFTFSAEVLSGPDPSTIFLCDTPSEEQDDESSLSSNSVPDLKKSYAFVESMSGEGYEVYDDDEEEYSSEWDQNVQNEETVPLAMIHTRKWPSRRFINSKATSSFPRYSLALGFLVGCFIQSSSLGANYVLTVLFGHDFEQIKEHHDKIILFSLLWSLGTSTMGVLVILFLRSLLQAIPNASSHSPLHLWHVEYSFAFGALVGVCMAWTGTDIMLGFKAHAFHSLMTLFVALAVKLCMSCSCSDVELSGRRSLRGEDDMEELTDSSLSGVYYPLKEKVDERNSWNKLHRLFKVNGTILGVLIGFFIQMSSLGASFLLDTFAGGDEETPRMQISTDGLLAFSLGWSFVFGTMGVMILVILRVLMAHVSGGISNTFATKIGLMLEFYFAVGCLVGVNLAWVLTDLGLGLKAHVMRSLLTLAAAAIWCRVLACCFFPTGSFEVADGDDDEEADGNTDEEEMLLFRSKIATTLPRRQPEVYEGIVLV